jgi:hypothetical protein
MIIEFLEGVTMKSVGSSVATPCSSEEARHFRGTNKTKEQHWEAEVPATLPPDYTDFLLGLLSDPEDGSDVPPKRRAISELYGVTTQKTEFFIKNDLKCDLAT